MPRGILWVASRVVQKDKLSDEAFCGWYEDIHIQQVLSLSGVPSAARYEALKPQPDPETWSSEAPWLTVYEMPDIDFRHTEQFKNLDGQSKPDEELLNKIFLNARFDTRFYEEVQVYEKPGAAKGPATFLLSAALSPPSTPTALSSFDAWYRDEHIAVLARAPGYIRTRRYALVYGTALTQFERTEPEIPRFLALHEFEGETLPWKELKESAETDWARSVMGGLVRSEVGWYGRKRVYEEGEWGHVGKE